MIYPKCKTKSTQVPAVRYDGYVTPCCHMSGWGDIEKLRDRIGNMVEQMHITNGTLDEINQSDAYRYIESTFTENPLPVCIKHCSCPDNIENTKTNANSDFKKISL